MCVLCCQKRSTVAVCDECKEQWLSGPLFRDGLGCFGWQPSCSSYGLNLPLEDSAPSKSSHLAVLEKFCCSMGGMFARRTTFLLTIPTSPPDLPNVLTPTLVGPMLFVKYNTDDSWSY